MPSVAQGSRIYLDAFYYDAAGALVDPTGPTVAIVGPSGSVVAAPITPTRASVGHFVYPDGGYFVTSDAPTGTWLARWTGEVEGIELDPIDDAFEVTAAQAPSPPWITLDEARAYAPCASGTSTPDAQLARAIRVASTILHRYGRRYGQTTTTVRPVICSPACPCARIGYAVAGSHVNGCGCSHATEVVLPGHAASVTEVRVDGALLPPSAWHLYDGRRLVRADGQSWPCCQRLADPADFTVTLVRGLPPDELAKMAAAELACHLALAMGDSGECRLASNVVAVTRQGVSQQIEVSTFLDLPLVATYLAANPGARRPRPTIAGPDRIRPTRAG